MAELRSSAQIKRYGQVNRAVFTICKLFSFFANEIETLILQPI